MRFIFKFVMFFLGFLKAMFLVCLDVLYVLFFKKPVSFIKHYFLNKKTKPNLT